MATATKDVERIVRRVLKEEQDDTINAIQELSELLTEQVIPRLSGEGDDDAEESSESETDEDGDVVSLSAFDSERAGRRGKPSPNGHDDSAEAGDDAPERELPDAVLEAFTAMYQTLSPEQASALAELFTAVDRQRGNEGGEDEEQDEEARAYA